MSQKQVGGLIALLIGLALVIIGLFVHQRHQQQTEESHHVVIGLNLQTEPQETATDTGFIVLMACGAVLAVIGIGVALARRK